MRLRQSPQYTLNNVLLNLIEYMKKWGGGQLDIRPPNLKIGGMCVAPISPRIDAPDQEKFDFLMEVTSQRRAFARNVEFSLSFQVEKEPIPFV